MKSSSAWGILLRFAACAALIAGSSSGVEAQDVCTQSSHAIATQADADTLSSCGNVTGIINVHSDSLTSLVLNGIQRLDGSLNISSCPALAQISAPQLEWINHNLTLSSLPLLTNLSLPSLETVLDSLSWTSLPLLTHPTLKTVGTDALGNPGTNLYGDLMIQDCGFQSLDFFNFGTYAKAGNILVEGNSQMGKINLTTLVYSASLDFENNGPGLQVYLPELTSVGSLKLKHVTELHVSNLTTMDAVLTLDENYFQTFEVSQLSSIGGDVFVQNNAQMATLNFPALTKIGGGIYDGDFVIANNSLLSDITGMPLLNYVDGNTSLSGNIATVSIPLLKDISGGFHISTTVPDFNCTYWDRLFYSSPLAADTSLYSCAAHSDNSAHDSAIHYDPPNSGPAIPKATLVIIIIVCIVVGALILGIGIRYWCRRRNRGRLQEPPPISLRELGVGEEEGEGVDGLPAYRRVGKPGEVPPRYKENEPASQDQNQGPSEVQREGQNQGQAQEQSENQREIQHQPPVRMTGLRGRLAGWHWEFSRLPSRNGGNGV